jgi:hypothetical protein
MARQTQRKVFGKTLPLSVSYSFPHGNFGNSLAPVSLYKLQMGGLDIMSSPQNQESGLLTHFAAGLRLRLTLSYTLTRHILSPHSLNLRYKVSLQQVVTSSVWEVISLSFWLLRQVWIWTRFLPVQSVVLLNWFLRFCGLLCASEALTLTCQEGKSPSRSSCPLTPGRISS